MPHYSCDDLINIPFTIKPILISVDQNNLTTDLNNKKVSLKNINLTISSSNPLIDNLQIDFTGDVFIVTSVGNNPQSAIFSDDIELFKDTVLIGKAILNFNVVFVLDNNYNITKILISGFNNESYFTFSGPYLSNFLSYPSFDGCPDLSDSFTRLTNTIITVLNESYKDKPIDHLICDIALNVPMELYRLATDITQICQCLKEETTTKDECDFHVNRRLVIITKLTALINNLSAEISKLKPSTRLSYTNFKSALTISKLLGDINTLVECNRCCPDDTDSDSVDLECKPCIKQVAKPNNIDNRLDKLEKAFKQLDNIIGNNNNKINKLFKRK